jgi:hypothetical protein
MVNYLSANQSLVLFALAGVDKELGPGPHAVAAIIDRIWQNQLALHGDLEDPEVQASLVVRAAAGERAARQTLRICEALHRRTAARIRAHKRSRTKRVWGKAIDAINPTNCFRRLASRGLIERSIRPGSSMVALTEEGRQFASRLFYTVDAQIQLKPDLTSLELQHGRTA